METINTAEPERRSVRKLILGVVLLLFGVLAFADSTNWWDARDILRLWPFALILIGLASETDALIARHGSGGSVMIAFGAWFLAGRYGILGLTHRTAFPIAIAVVGLFMTLHALLDRPESRKKETNHEPC